MKIIFIEKYYSNNWGDNEAKYRTILETNKNCSFLNINDYIKIDKYDKYFIIKKEYDAQKDILIYYVNKN